MEKCLFLLCLCLVPFVVFSSTTQNPIELPSSNSVPVLDVRGRPLNTRVSYRIVSVGRGAAGGDVYLGPSPNSGAPCDNGVFRYNSDTGPRGTPLLFVAESWRPSVIPTTIFENQDINILFDHFPDISCFRYTVWKVGDYDVSLGARLLETGGTIRQEDSSWFKIVKSPQLGYNLFYCPGPFVSPSSPLDQCQAVGQVEQDGKRRLALVNDQPLDVNFVSA